MSDHDLYSYSAAAIEAPPRTFFGTLARIGPGMLLSAAIVGTGELIATTRLGSEVGYVMLWAILASCAIKTVVQAVWGRYTIATGETGLAALNRVPGPRLANVNWVVWVWAIMVVFSLSLFGAMYAGIAQVMVRMFPGSVESVWVIGVTVLTLVVLLAGSYRHIEFGAVVMVGVFTLMTVFAAAVLTSKPEYFSWTQLASGLEFSLPEQGILIAVTVFGLTGVNAGELAAYPYWCIEKGYARFTGPRTHDEAWRARAKGWIRVMHWDIFVSMLVYTLATVAFYLLGAGVLHTLGQVPQGKDMIATLSRMYTETLGEFGLYLFYAGAVVVLYSTVFAALAASARSYADMLRLMGAFRANDYRARLKFQRVFVTLLVLIPCAIYFLIGEPVRMVKMGGLAAAFGLPVMAIAVVYLRHRHMPKEVAPSTWTTVLLWVTTALIAVTMLASILRTLGLLGA
jgi:manganese transport protein